MGSIGTFMTPGRLKNSGPLHLCLLLAFIYLSHESVHAPTQFQISALPRLQRWAWLVGFSELTCGQGQAHHALTVMILVS